MCTYKYTRLLLIIILLYSESATDVNTHVAQMAIQAIGKISVRIGSQANICVDSLLALLNMEIDHITSETVTTMTSKFIVHVNFLSHCGCLFVVLVS